MRKSIESCFIVATKSVLIESPCRLPENHRDSAKGEKKLPETPQLSLQDELKSILTLAKHDFS